MNVRSPRVAVCLVVVSMLLLTAGVVAIMVAPHGPPGGGSRLALISFVPPVAAFAFVGGMIAVRRP